ncbi:DUF2441 domain-containing protein [Paenibacillus terrigena]|uniref:DUF2441 domain-containing protein n=1 Tax=Paenibacillus terrigena TaxID=369333 RepID=UPI0028D3DECF|nr:DUF2441 domain-containing protein [Paenibacillus terrigena]
MVQRNKRWGEKDGWKIGNLIEIGSIHNKLMESRFSTDYCMNPELDFEKECRRLQHKELDQNDIQYLNNMSNVWREFISQTREYIFEIERIQIDPDLPSRFKCLFVTDLVGIKYWNTQAKRYWTGVDADLEGNEYLFEGIVKVLEIIK